LMFFLMPRSALHVINLQAVREAATICPAPVTLTFDL